VIHGCGGGLGGGQLKYQNKKTVGVATLPRRILTSSNGPQGKTPPQIFPLVFVSFWTGVGPRLVPWGGTHRGARLACCSYFYIMLDRYVVEEGQKMMKTVWMAPALPTSRLLVG
jgi:hypothetical protein